jgi:hypothetical protein
MAAGSVVALSLAYVRVGDDDDGIVQSGGNSDMVEELIPARNSQVLQQTTVGIDLTTGWDGSLVIEGQEIPAEQVAVRAPDRLEFTPGDGKVISTLPTGHVCVQAIVWETRTGRTDDARTVGWCFEVL